MLNIYQIIHEHIIKPYRRGSARFSPIETNRCTLSEANMAREASTADYLKRLRIPNLNSLKSADCR